MNEFKMKYVCSICGAEFDNKFDRDKCEWQCLSAKVKETENTFNTNIIQESYNAMNGVHPGVDDAMVEYIHNKTNNAKTTSNDRLNNLYKVSENLATNIGQDKQPETDIVKSTYTEISSYHEGTEDLTKINTDYSDVRYIIRLVSHLNEDFKQIKKLVNMFEDDLSDLNTECETLIKR